MYYDRQGQPIADVLEWARLMEVDENKFVEQTEIAPGILVSTVWLGIDHSLLGSPPLIFETLIFGGALDQEMDRYPTEAAARAGHERMCALARAAYSPSLDGPYPEPGADGRVTFEIHSEEK